MQEDSDEEVELEEVSGYHFMDCMPLFVSYVYVTSGRIYLYFMHIYCIYTKIRSNVYTTYVYYILYLLVLQ